MDSTKRFAYSNDRLGLSINTNRLPMAYFSNHYKIGLFIYTSDDRFSVAVQSKYEILQFKRKIDLTNLFVYNNKPCYFMN